MIPKIIHQTWKSSNLPENFRAYQKTWILHHPDWEYCFYDDAACRAVVQKYFPELLALYDDCASAVQRADIFRYLVVAVSGGIYADIDMECYKNVEPLLAGKECVFGVETQLSPRQARLLNHRHSERIANCIFAAKSNHPIFGKVIEEVVGRLKGDYHHRGIIETTGPGMLTDVVQKYRQQYELNILPQICWLPPTSPDYPNSFPFNLHIYAKHHFSGTWKKENEDLPDTSCNGLQCGAWPIMQMRKMAKACLSLCDIRELYYKLPPSPVWREDFYFWRK
jgi:inositol phosphorylceramide mannosyltransferase catalytic subunit